MCFVLILCTTASVFPDIFPQLTCMYNLLSGTISQNFTQYPSDMLLYFKWVCLHEFKVPLVWKSIHLFTDFPSLYYSKKDVSTANCRSYITALGAADFSVSPSLLNKGSRLLSEAKTCLVSFIKIMINYCTKTDNRYCKGSSKQRKL